MQVEKGKDNRFRVIFTTSLKPGVVIGKYARIPQTPEQVQAKIDNLVAVKGIDVARAAAESMAPAFGLEYENGRSRRRRSPAASSSSGDEETA